MRRSFPVLALSVLATLVLSSLAAAQSIVAKQWLPQGAAGPAPGGAQRVPGLFLPRGTLDLRMEPRGSPSPSASWMPTEAPTFVPVPRMSSSFVAEADGTQLAITFSAEAQTSQAGKRMFVRALIDGAVAAPADAVFTEGGFGGARSFVFTGVVDAGVHTVEMQWLVDPGASASLRTASLMLRHGTTHDAGGVVVHRTPPSGPDERTSESTWQPIPGMSTSLWLPKEAEPIVTFSAETFVSGVNKRMFVRALIDGVPLSPGDVVFAQRSSRQSHCMRFTGPALAEGVHTVSLQWLVDPGGGATVGDRTLLVCAFPQSSALRHDLVVAPSGPSIANASGAWSQVPDLSALVSLPANAELAVSFSGEVSASPNAELEMRLMANGVVIDQESVFLASFGQPFEVQSFTFDRKHIFLPETTLTGIWLEWRASGGTVWVADRTMELVVEKGLVPDLAEAPEIGVGDGEFPSGRPVEAAIGTRPLLTIIHRIPRAAPNHVVPTVAQVTDALYGPRGVADYYAQVSRGRFGFVDAGVLSFPSLKSEAHYWGHGPFDCGQPLQDGFSGGHAERWAEAITLAAGSIDFASYDTDQDGTVDSNELAILIVVPQGSPDGFTRTLDPYCSGADLVVDGVVIPQMSEWFTSSPSLSWEVAAHELAHQVLGLGDMYANGLNFDTEAGRLSLMADNFGTTSHVDAVQKLALGWATPWYSDGGYGELLDVKASGQVLVLPRDEDGDGKECFVAEVRKATTNDPLYDTGTGANGLVVWHYVEDPAQSASPPLCTPPAIWAAVSGNLRRSLRVVRPGIVFAGGGPSCWDAGDYDLLDVGLVCPPGDAQNALRWADGGASGWRLRAFSPAWPVMSFEIEAP